MAGVQGLPRLLHVIELPAPTIRSDPDDLVSGLDQIVILGDEPQLLGLSGAKSERKDGCDRPFHGLSLLFAEGINPAEIAEQMGHSLQTLLTTYVHIIEELRGLPAQDALHRLLGNLRTMISAGELPIFVDEGGLIDAQGFLSEPIKTIIGSLTPDDEAYLFLVARQRPRGSDKDIIPIVHLDPLKNADTQRLLSLLASQDGIRLNSNETSDLAEYVAGYPPAAYYAVQQARDYGIDIVLSNREQLAAYSVA